MNDAAVRWAESQLGATIAAVTALTGGTTSTMLRLRDTAGHDSVLRLMTNEPWRTHGAELTARERDAQRELASTAVPAPTSLALDADGAAAGVAAHLMSRVPGVPGTDIDESMLTAMARMLATIHAVSPREPFRTFQSWAWEAKRGVPAWSNHPDSWRHAFEILAGAAPSYVPTFLHRDFSHRNLLWTGDAITGVVDWVESSTGPAWLDAGHAATNLAIAFGAEPARQFLTAYAAVAREERDRHWLVMDAVGFLPPPGRSPLFGSDLELARLDDWLHELVS